MTLKRTVVIVAVLTASIATGEVRLSPGALEQLDQALSRPVRVYSTDARAGEAILARVDLWAGSQMDLRKAKTSSSRDSTRTIYVATERENRPIWAERGQGKGIVAGQPFLVRYTKEPGKRSFVKDLHVPSQQKLAPSDVSAIARRLVEVSGLSSTTSTDRYGRAQVVSRVRLHSDYRGKVDSSFTLVQRVILKRQISELEVVNSKQVVDVHPASHEILAYKNIDWTPVDEASAEMRPYKTREKLLAQIDSAFAGVPTPQLIERIQQCYYQVDSHVLPALAVYPRRDAGDTGIGRVVYIGLADVDIRPPRRTNPRRPASAH